MTWHRRYGLTIEVTAELTCGPPAARQVERPVRRSGSEARGDWDDDSYSGRDRRKVGSRAADRADEPAQARAADDLPRPLVGCGRERQRVLL